MKIIVDLNYVSHFAEVTPAELDVFNKVMSRFVAVDENYRDNATVFDLKVEAKVDYKIRVLSDTATINIVEE